MSRNEIAAASLALLCGPMWGAGCIDLDAHSDPASDQATGSLSGKLSVKLPVNLADRPEAVASVNGAFITIAYVAEGLAQYKKENGATALRSQDLLAKVRQQLVDRRIQELLLLQAADKQGIEVSNEDIERAVLRRRAAYPGHSFEEMLSKQGIRPSTLRAAISERLRIKALLDREVNARVVITDQEVTDWHQAHPEALQQPEQVHAFQIVVRTEEEATQIYDQLRRSGDFHEAARHHSVAPEGQHGGDLGWISPGTMPTPIDSTCFQLPVGRLSRVIESPYGYHLFKVTERRRASTRELDGEIRLETEEKLRLAKEEAAQRAFRTRLQRSAQIAIDTARLAEVK